jgi:hypothetical protein
MHRLLLGRTGFVFFRLRRPNGKARRPDDVLTVYIGQYSLQVAHSFLSPGNLLHFYLVDCLIDVIDGGSGNTMTCYPLKPDYNVDIRFLDPTTSTTAHFSVV